MPIVSRDCAERLAFQLKAIGVTGWVREHRFCERRFRFDLAFPAKLLAVECDGGIWNGGRHVRGRGVLSDCEKASLAAILGWRMIRVTPQHVKSGEAIQWIEKALAA